MSHTFYFLVHKEHFLWAFENGNSKLSMSTEGYLENHNALMIMQLPDNHPISYTSWPLNSSVNHRWYVHHTYTIKRVPKISIHIRPFPYPFPKHLSEKMPHRKPPSLPLPFLVSNLNLPLPYNLLLLSSPPPSNQRCKFLHWLTSNISSSRHPSTTASTPTPVTRTQPRTESSRSSRRWRPIERREESETAEPQKESRSDVREGQPRERTSVAVSERAQQNDCRY